MLCQSGNQEVKDWLESPTRASFLTCSCSCKVFHPTMLLLPELSCYCGELQQSTNMAKLKMAHWVTEQPQDSGALRSAPSLPVVCFSWLEQTKPTTTDLITKMQATLRSLMEDYWLVRPLLNLCLQLLSLQRKDTVNLCHKDLLPQELFKDTHCHYSLASNHVHASPLVFVE